MTRPEKSLRLGMLCSSIRDGTHGSYERVLDGVPLLSAKNVLDGAIQISESESMVSRGDASEIARPGAFRNGDVLLTIVGTIGRVAIHDVEERVVFQRSVASLRPGPGIENRYLAWSMRSQDFQDELALRARQSAQAGVYLTDVADISVPMPPLEMQRRIADFLDDQVARIDNIIAARVQQAALLGEFRDAMASRAFDVFDPSDLVPLRRVVSRWIDYRGATPTKTDSGIPLVTARNIRDGEVDLRESQEFISESDYIAWMRRGLPEVGDVLLTTEAPLGQVAEVAEINIALAQRIILLRPESSRIDGRWLYWYLRSPLGSRELWSRATGTTAPGIKAERLRDVPIPLPPIAEQRRRLVDVEEVDVAWRTMQAGMLRSVEMFRDLKLALISAAVTGDFDVSSADGSRVPV